VGIEENTQNLEGSNFSAIDKMAKKPPRKEKLEETNYVHNEPVKRGGRRITERVKNRKDLRPKASEPHRKKET